MRSFTVFCFVFTFFFAFICAHRNVIGKRTQAPRSWKIVGPAEDTARLTFIIALKQKNLDVLEKLYWDRSNPNSPNYQEWMDIEEINKLVSPPKEEHDKVISWLQNYQIEKLTSFGDAIEVTASVGSLKKIFETDFHTFTNDKGLRVVRHWGELSVPSNVAKSIYFVTGLSTFPFPRNTILKKKIKRNTEDLLTYVVPQTIYQLYSIPNNTRIIHNASQGVIEWDEEYYDPADLTGFGTNMAVPYLNLPTPDHVIGVNNPELAGEESTLDIEWIAATGIGAENWFWIESGTSWLYGFAVHFLNTKIVPSVNSISYGWDEDDQCEDGIGEAECNSLGVDSTQYVERVNIEFQKIGLRGVTLFVASGDSGVHGRNDEFCSDDIFHADFPGGSPFITSVGATRIVDAETDLVNPPPVCQSAVYWWCASGGTEEAVSWSSSGFTSGGGFSNITLMPDFQKSAVTAYLQTDEAKKTPSSYYNPAGRAYPDISGLGEGILIWIDDDDSSVGGTSCSAPIVAGIFSLLNDYSIGKTGKSLGPVNQLIYDMAAKHPAAFTDVTVGDNSCTESGCGLFGCYGFYCAKGWDAVTGLGTPVYSEMLAYLKTVL